MKLILVVYALISIAFQIILGQLTGYGQGSVGVLLFLFIVEVDPRFKFSYVMPNLRERHDEQVECEAGHEKT